MKITFLAADVPLTKTFTLENGEIQKQGHPQLVSCTSFEEEAATLADFYVALRAHAELGHCLLKGNVTRRLVGESRAGTTEPNAPTRWMCLDLDGLKHIGSVDEFMASVGLGDASYIVQYSSSMGVLPGKGLSAHVFVLLDREHLPDALKQWLKAKNFAVDGLRRGLSLTRTGNALRWTLDVSTCQNDKLIYIAPPLIGPGVIDSFDGERIRLVRKARETVALDSFGISAEANRASEQRTLDQLRAEKGLEKKPWDRAKISHGVTYMPKPDVATLTGLREERGFVYMNLNGGDSWAYYHPKDNPTFIHNFKGEPVFKTAELLPEYWASLRREQRAERRDDREYMVFRDWEGSTYYNAVYDARADELRVAAAKGKEQVLEWLAEHGQPIPEVVETWDMAFDALNPKRFDRKQKWLNTYQPSELERRYRKEHPEVRDMPAVARKWWLHALGGDERALGRLVNWCACLVQFKEAVRTAWYLQGVEGTGKGIIFNFYLKAMLGPTNVVEKRITELDTEFTGFLEGKLLLFVDDTPDVEAQKAAEVLSSFFRNLITEPSISVRHMRQMHRVVKNWLSIIVTSNRTGITIGPTDRRWNIAPHQPVQPPKPDEAEIREIEASVWPMYCYLMQYPADRQLARTALDNEAKRSLAARSVNTIEEFARALIEGNYGYFEAAISVDPKGMFASQAALAAEYKALVERMKAADRLTRDEIHTLCQWLLGPSCPSGATKFGKMLSYHNVPMKVIKDKATGRSAHGMYITWRVECSTDSGGSSSGAS